MTHGELICTRCGQTGHVAANCKRPGVWTIDEFRLRCDVDEASGCWLPHSSSPRHYVPHYRRHVGPGPMLWALQHMGARIPAGKVYAATCGNSFCCNPKHRKLVRRGTHMRYHGIERSMECRMRISMKRKAQCPSRLTDAQMRELEMGARPITEMARDFGISYTYAYQIVTGRRRTSITNNPYAALVA